MAAKRSSCSAGAGEDQCQETPPKLARKADRASRTDNGEGFPEPLACPVCLLGMSEEILLCKMGHSFCKECFQELQQKRLPCAICRIPLPAEPGRNFCLEQMAASITFPCKWGGCGFTGIPGQLRFHQRMCKHRAFQCIVPGCSTKLPEQGIEKHLVEQHGFFRGLYWLSSAPTERDFWSDVHWEAGKVGRVSGALYAVPPSSYKDQTVRFVIYSFCQSGQATVTIEKAGIGKVAITFPTVRAEEAKEVETNDFAMTSSAFTFSRSLVARFVHLVDGRYTLPFHASIEPDPC